MTAAQARWAHLRRIDPEIGPVRLCQRCGEWWPDDAEFFYPTVAWRACRACQIEWHRRAKRDAAA